jgi:cytochrome c biogenesis protein CcmG, thiol:disulfide interchange protein DsbE
MIFVSACRRGDAITVPPASHDGTFSLQPGDMPLESRIAGRVAVIDFWATWCEPCRTSIPKVVGFAQEHAQELVVVGVHVGHGFADALDFASEAGIAYPLYADPDLRLSGRLGASKVPTVVVLDRNGNAVHRATEIDDAVERAVRDALRSA